VYSALLKVLALFCGVVLGWFSLQATRVGTSILHTFMDGKLPNIMSGAPFLLHVSMPSWCPLYDLSGYGGLLYGGADLAAEGVSQGIAGLLIGLSAYVILLFVAGYVLSIWHSGTVLMFCVLLKKKDDKDLLAEKDTDELLAEETEASTKVEPGTIPEAKAATPEASAKG
jgi:hypothetical protein